MVVRVGHARFYHSAAGRVAYGTPSRRGPRCLACTYGSSAAAVPTALRPLPGFYRLTRGSFAQFGLPVPYPERVVDAVLDHARDARHFGPGRENACNVLDVTHPL
ncbi:hypothetical protein RKD20_001226 [Streptomyces sp. SLBN-8D4]